MIFYFSGTGNTKWAAEYIAQQTGETLLYIPDELRKATRRQDTAIGSPASEYVLEEGERLGFCFPTHGWQPPRIVREFIRQSSFRVKPAASPSAGDIPASPYCYALTTCGDNMGEAMTILNKELAPKGLHTSATFALLMPESNVCFPFLHLDTPAREKQKLLQARMTLERFAQHIVNRKESVNELIKGAIPRTYSYVIGHYYNRHLITDRKFWVDTDSCIQCGLCARLCPVGDIALSSPHKETKESVSGFPQWLHNQQCTNCLSCYHHCPRHAIHWGKMKRGQYVFRIPQ